MKVTRMGMIEILRRIWLFFANKIKSSESVDNQLNSSLRHTIVTKGVRSMDGQKAGLLNFWCAQVRSIAGRISCVKAVEK